MERHDPDTLRKATDGLRELILAAEHYRHVVADELGVGVTESRAVSYLFVRGPMGQGELGALLALNTSSMTALVDRLERAGIAERQPHASDRRRLIVRLTDSGRERVTRTSDWLGNAFQSISPTNLADVTASLHIIADDLRYQALPDAARTNVRRTQP
jgi:DNA-binding MarR family transcriptional regulator